MSEIQRWAIGPTDYGVLAFRSEKSDKGPWVTFDDHQAAASEHEEQVGRLEAEFEKRVEHYRRWLKEAMTERDAAQEEIRRLREAAREAIHAAETLAFHTHGRSENREVAEAKEQFERARAALKSSGEGDTHG